MSGPQRDNNEISSAEVAQALLDTVPRSMRFIRAQFRAQEDLGLTLPQLRLVGKLSRGPKTNAQLARLMGVTLPAITKMVKSLEDDSYVKRKTDATDRRSAQIYCTKKGEAIRKRVRGRVLGILADACQDLSATQRVALLNGLAVLATLPGDQEEGEG